MNTYTTIIKVGFYCSENLSVATKELSLANMFVACLVVRLDVFLDPSIGRTPKLAFSKLSEISRLILGDIRYMKTSACTIQSSISLECEHLVFYKACL